jgi:hypothetical protein
MTISEKKMLTFAAGKGLNVSSQKIVLYYFVTQTDNTFSNTLKN